ncbi:DUF928 domain-containing protein [Oscillatoria sp. FACHB-1407]|uniref:DUF928 domain-containing protein n=1 Tax=Oscillatoria sp. FACHB-1407 TaxID=2692847 RepID=UPI001688C078|nr:DUF928 domain-containing protein [Oscillatoria sp. FACHB-1407]MBD2464604.1 DUF928 domain-containing protein [Oscillatoria sp. FACHB-1407]
MKYPAAIALTLISLIHATAPALAYPTLLTSTLKQTPPAPPDRGAPGDRLRGGAVWYTPPTPPERGIPEGRTRGGASRGDCSAAATAQSLTALAPSTPLNTPTARNSVWGLTTVEHPTFWFYIPYEITPNLPMEFVLLDEEDNVVYQTTLTLNSPSGVINITPPSTAPGLEVGKMYRWYFLVYCNADNPIFTQGGIQRITPNAELAAMLQRSPARERAMLYATNGIWFDALTTLATLRQAEPNNGAIAADWTSLLQSVDLEDVAQQRFAPCCTLPVTR